MATTTKKERKKANDNAITLPRGIRPHRSGYIVDVTVGGKRRTKTAATLEADGFRETESVLKNKAGQPARP